MRDKWVSTSLHWSAQRSPLWGGGRKILTDRSIQFNRPLDDTSLRLADCGYTTNKLKQLTRNYLHGDSHQLAVELWEKRLAKAKYGSVGFTCYNHLLKQDPGKSSRIASVMGPCIQAMTITWVDRQTAVAHAFYRTTELYKKFPADLVFIRDVLLEPFDFRRTNLVSLTCYFANATIHPMYMVTVIPFMPQPIATLQGWADQDPKFYREVIKWLARFLCPEYYRGIAKFAQAGRVYDDAQARIKPVVKKQLQDYIRKNITGNLIKGDDDDAEDHDD